MGRPKRLDYTQYVSNGQVAYHVADNNVQVYTGASNGVPKRATVTSYSKVRTLYVLELNSIDVLHCTAWLLACRAMMYVYVRTSTQCISLFYVL